MTENELKKLLGPRRRTLSEDEGVEIRLALKDLLPIESGHSLHCWHERYSYNGKFYELLGEFGLSDTLPIIEEVLL